MSYRYLDGGFILAIVIGLAIGIFIAVLYFRNLQQLLQQVSEENRQMKPGQVWLLLIPLFSLIYAFIAYPKISDSLKAEYEQRGIPSTGDYLRTLGITMASLNAGSAVLGRVVPSLGPFLMLVNLAAVVIWIIYWVKAAQFKNELMNAPKGEGGFSMSSSDLLDR